MLAGRLSEHFDVLLLEAGGNPPPAAAVPYYREFVLRDPSINYFFKSVPQTNASLCCDGVNAFIFQHFQNIIPMLPLIYPKKERLS